MQALNPIKDRPLDATSPILPASHSEVNDRAAEVTAGDRPRATDRSSLRRHARCQPCSSRARRAIRFRQPSVSCTAGSMCSNDRSRSAGRIGPRPPAAPFPRCHAEDSSRLPTTRPCAVSGQASSRPSPIKGSSSRIASTVEDRTRAEASRNWRRSASREMDSSSSLSDRRMTSVLDRALSCRRSRRT